jgi:hypothetical protein
MKLYQLIWNDEQMNNSGHICIYIVKGKYVIITDKQ